MIPVILLPVHSKKRNVFSKITMRESQKLLLEVKNKSTRKDPFLKIPNESGTVRLFIEALNKNAEEEARKYLSKVIASNVDLSDAYHLFGPKKKYTCLKKFSFSHLYQSSTVLIAVGNNEEIVQVKVVKEPDNDGVWKILEIRKD